jgi:NADH-quinone oxidoreductase subunit J
MAEQIIFALLAIVTLGSAFAVVTERNLFHAAVALMLSFLGVAGFYVMLNAGFLAAAQLLVYIGAISILIIFAIMMTRRMMSTTEPAFNSQWAGSIAAAGLIFAVLAGTIVSVWSLDGPGAPGEAQGVPDAVLGESFVELGRLFVSADGYVLPFELVSVLLLAALVGAVVVALPEREQ